MRYSAFVGAALVERGGVKTSSGTLPLHADPFAGGHPGRPRRNADLFTREKIDRTFQYEIDGLYDPTKITIDSTFDKLSLAYSPPGPFATWRLTIDPDVNPGLDLSMADRLTVEFRNLLPPRLTPSDRDLDVGRGRREQALRRAPIAAAFVQGRRLVTFLESCIL